MHDAMTPAEKAARAQVFADVLRMSIRWKAFWGAYQEWPAASRAGGLAEAIALFRNDECSRQDGIGGIEDIALRGQLFMAMAAKAIPLSKTHSESAVLDTMAQMASGKATSPHISKVPRKFWRRTWNSRVVRSYVASCVTWWVGQAIWSIKEDDDFFSTSRQYVAGAVGIPIALAVVMLVWCWAVRAKP